MCRNTCHKGKMKKGVFEMANGIGKIGGGGYEGLNPYFRREGKGVEEQQVAAEQKAPETKEVNPEEVLAFMAAGNTLAKPVEKELPEFKVSPEVFARVTESMARFEASFQVAKDEFGEDVALQIMNLM